MQAKWSSVGSSFSYGKEKKGQEREIIPSRAQDQETLSF
jgi:hypothetical protein